MLSPPLDMKEKWFAPHTAYSMAKFGMSLVVLGLAGELRGKDRGQCAVAAHHHRHRRDQEPARRRRDDAHVAQAGDPGRRRLRASSKSRRASPGNFLIDDTFLAGEGVTDFDQYRADPGQPLQSDFFVPDDMPPPTRRQPGRQSALIERPSHRTRLRVMPILGEVDS